MPSSLQDGFYLAGIAASQVNEKEERNLPPFPGVSM